MCQLFFHTSPNRICQVDEDNSSFDVREVRREVSLMSKHVFFCFLENKSKPNNYESFSTFVCLRVGGCGVGGVYGGGVRGGGWGGAGGILLLNFHFTYFYS